MEFWQEKFAELTKYVRKEWTSPMTISKYTEYHTHLLQFPQRAWSCLGSTNTFQDVTNLVVLFLRQHHDPPVACLWCSICSQRVSLTTNYNLQQLVGDLAKMATTDNFRQPETLIPEPSSTFLAATASRYIPRSVSITFLGTSSFLTSSLLMSHPKLLSLIFLYPAASLVNLFCVTFLVIVVLTSLYFLTRRSWLPYSDVLSLDVLSSVLFTTVFHPSMISHT